MKRALIQPPNRIAQVEPVEFPVAPPLFWVDCDDEVTPETHGFDGTNFVLKLQPPVQQPVDQSDIDNLQKQMKALALLVRDYCNDLKAEVRGLAVLLVSKGTITGPEAAALKAYDGTGTNDAKTVQDLKDDFAAKFNALP